MNTIALYVVVGFSGIIFVTANGQGDAGCDNRTCVQYLPTYDVDFFIFHSQLGVDAYETFTGLYFFLLQIFSNVL